MGVLFSSSIFLYMLRFPQLARILMLCYIEFTKRLNVV
jgi:hypothetical protein